ncbi:guanitoxin biosynthesis heme-dependent pre-guanitoxin N-hydroxylase GntA [Erythrobacter sp.]|uniref:guanitoxin biosynthesis heme-dependent pre-guanitoxin N-hydroxylase GntA n=1 Tax=Erythrobacter sp. TaxID=1042 RepID=UPI0025D0610A|nr:guanitoxin biosynthesis heme-dependent pre-guanitoxin N-hydroxylase GntA [Erythrobacter sp.]
MALAPHAGNRDSADDKEHGEEPGQLQRSLAALIERQEFPCVGAKSALAQGTLEIVTARSITSACDDQRIHDALVQWSAGHEPDEKVFRSFAVVFAGPTSLTERAFEEALWARLGSLIVKDGQRGNDYDPAYSDDPNDPHFALSFGGRAFFAVGLHPRAARRARRAAYPTIVLNPHDQFERLRAQQRYERMREVILARDEEFDGEPNPMIARHGEVSEARQYSGRQVGEDWQCPFSPKDLS